MDPFEEAQEQFDVIGSGNFGSGALHEPAHDQSLTEAVSRISDVENVSARTVQYDYHDPVIYKLSIDTLLTNQGALENLAKRVADVVVAEWPENLDYHVMMIALGHDGETALSVSKATPFAERWKRNEACVPSVDSDGAVEAIVEAFRTDPTFDDQRPDKDASDPDALPGAVIGEILLRRYEQRNVGVETDRLLRGMAQRRVGSILKEMSRVGDRLITTDGRVVVRIKQPSTA